MRLILQSENDRQIIYFIYEHRMFVRKIIDKWQREVRIKYGRFKCLSFAEIEKVDWIKSDNGQYWFYITDQYTHYKFPGMIAYKVSWFHGLNIKL